MARTMQTGLGKKRLRIWIALFFVALAIPTGILISQAHSQLKWEAFHQHRLVAEELAGRIDSRLSELILAEESHSFGDYGFLVVSGDPSARFLRPSGLSRYPVESAIPGLIGHFQVDDLGAFSTPLMPQKGTNAAAYGITSGELEKRRMLQTRIQEILSENRLVRGRESEIAASVKEERAAGSRQASSPTRRLDRPRTSATPELSSLEGQPRRRPDFETELMVSKKPVEEEVASQAAFDRLNAPASAELSEKKQGMDSRLGRVEDLKLDYRYQSEPADEIRRQITARTKVLPDKRPVRKERSALPVPPAASFEEADDAEAPPESAIRISTFESEIDPFEFSLLDSGHFVLFRKVWRDGRRYIQGALVEQQPFIEGVIGAGFNGSALSRMSDLIVAYRGDVFSVISGKTVREYVSSAEDLSGALLFQTRLSAPLNDLALLFSVTRMPSGPGAALIAWVSIVLAAVLIVGSYLMYRLGAGQIDLARQQQDFVSAVSHELKTPLTSIRMYGEMLREGWATEEKKRTYYDYIFDESERLSRLINNVLQLARMSRNDLRVELKRISAGELMDGIRSKISSQAERAGFNLSLKCEGEGAMAVVSVDADYFSQIFINLVDNAIKFSSRADNKSIEISCRIQADRQVLFAVRDYGPGVARDQMKKIFRLFYRSENELTRETVGTGIGLALVHQLARAMNGQVDVVNKDPGAEFCLRLSRELHPDE